MSQQLTLSLALRVVMVSSFCFAAGCSGLGFGKKRDAFAAAEDPFLDKPVKLIERKDSTLIGRIAPERSGGEMSAEDFAAEGSAEVAEPVLQAAYQEGQPADASGTFAGLGQASPWGSAPQDGAVSNSEVTLSFDDRSFGHSNNTRQVPDDPGALTDSNFGVDLNEFDENDFAPLDSPSNFGSELGRSDSSFEPPPVDQRPASESKRFGLFGTEAENAIGEQFEAIEEKAEETRSSLRNRFSRLGAKLGLGGDEKPRRKVRQSQTAATVGPTPPEQPVECIDQLIADAESRTENVNYSRLNQQQRDSYLRDQVNLRLFYLVNNQNERALDAIPGIPPSEQEFWQQMFWSLSQYRNSEAMPDRTERATQTVSQLRNALQRLQESAKLQLKNVSFCRQIGSFGNYERFENDTFRAGQPVLVYAEVDNFKSEPTTSGRYRTVLRSRLEIVKEHGDDKPVDSVTLQPVEDVCRNPRRDYFNSYEFTIPNDIAPGRYRLELTLDDQLSGKTAIESVLFTIK